MVAEVAKVNIAGLDITIILTQGVQPKPPAIVIVRQTVYPPPAAGPRSL